MKRLAVILFCCCLVGAGEADEPECFRNLANHFFDNDKAIMQALGLHRVTESSWTPIVHALQRQSRYILPLAREKAGLLANNPLDPFQPQAAEVVLNQAAVEVFQGVLRQFSVTNPDDITEMVGFIQRHQPNWQSCFSQ